MISRILSKGNHLAKYTQVPHRKKSAMADLAVRSGLPLEKIVEKLKEFAPTTLSEKWDNTGTLIEPFTPRPIKSILLTNDLTEDVMQEAIECNVQMIISYHPPIFSALKSVTQRTWKERIVSACLEKGIALYSPHTSWDSVPGGVNDWLAAALSPHCSVPILPSPTEEPGTGCGRLCTLQQGVSLHQVVERVKRHCGLQHVRLALARGGSLEGQVSTVALCAGSGSSVLRGVIAQLYITGEMLHHDVLDAVHNGTSVILTNHSDSERGFLKEFKPKFSEMFQNQIQMIVSEKDKDPLTTV